MPGKHTNVGAKRAREARARLGLDEASPVACVLALVEEEVKLPVIVGALPDDVAGALWRNGAGAIVWVNGGHAVERQRFTVAHELGHVCCGHTGTAVDTMQTLSGQTHDPWEVQANAFAAELLAPRAGVRALIDGEPNLEDVVRVAGQFGISAIAALYRCRTLDLVRDRRCEQLQSEIARNLHKYLASAQLRDGLSEIDEHPRLPASLAGSLLAAMLRGEAPVPPALSAALAALCR